MVASMVKGDSNVATPFARALSRATHIPRRLAYEIRGLPDRAKEAVAWCAADRSELPRRDCGACIEGLAGLVSENRDLGYFLSAPVPVGKVGEFDYVGVQSVDGDRAVFVPNGANHFAIVGRDGSVERICFDKRGNEGPFRWTGGAVWHGSLVCFPRTSNEMLLLDLRSREAHLIDLGQGYAREHHYGGVLVGDVVYQPPRGEDHILRTDLRSMASRRIPLAPKRIGFKPRYCGSILHPNGLVYFLPERGRVIEFDPATDRFRFIGRPVNAMAFSAALAPDGCLYGFSGYSRGVLRIDPERGSVEMLRRDIGCPGAYGTRLGVNGKLYSVPGDGNAVLELDPETLEVRGLCALGAPGGKAKCAGSATLRDGTLAFAPALGSDAYFLEPERPADIPGEIYDLFNDCY